ncbi:flagellar filament capping protein FliD [Pseudoduganella sp. OTU4001]|uniref:flagellar filament capping protein FliD n=1 Tax=Pseudoduganella sp. OTU4001 TaxID=3043854 RepID=UPI00313BFC9A
MATTAPTFDPKSTATNLAQLSVEGRQNILTAQTTSATAVAAALTKLSSAMTSFRSALSSLSSQSSVIANKATFSADIGTATADASAAPGTYQFYVEQLATAGQISYNGIADTSAANPGSLVVTLADGSNFTVTLANADSNHDNVLTAKEIAAAINIDAANNSRVTASTMSVNGQTRLVLTSTQSGADNAVTGIDTSQLTDAGLAASLDNANQVVLQTAKNAVVWIGAQGGDPTNRIEQATNTFKLIDGVSMTFTKAQAALENPVTLTVGRDDAGTAANVQSFVDSWNKLIATFKEVSAAGDPASGKAAGIYANDAGLAALKARMQQVLRTETGGQSLVTFGVSAQRDGTLSLDTKRLNKAISANPEALNDIFGKTTGVAPGGVLGDLDKLVNSWTKAGTGQLASRKDSNARLQATLATRQALLETQYDTAYKRYLAQFTQLQSLQSQMSGTTSMFDALFSKSST